jgi:hypothetical protein
VKQETVFYLEISLMDILNVTRAMKRKYHMLLKRPLAFIFFSQNNSVLFQIKYFSNFILHKCNKSLLSLLQNSYLWRVIKVEDWETNRPLY